MIGFSFVYTLLALSRVQMESMVIVSDYFIYLFIYLFILVLFDDTVSSSDYTASDNM
jgi:hypothetical protein